MYLEILTARKILPTHLKGKFQCLIIELYATYFQYGMEFQNAKKSLMQYDFVCFNFHPHLVLESKRFKVGSMHLIFLSD